MSARDRRPMTGRSNLSSARDTQRSRMTVDTARRNVLNDPIQVFRPFTPEDKDIYYHPPRILPSHVTDPIIPDFKTARRGNFKRPLACPQSFIDNMYKQDILDKSAFINHIDTERKTEICRGFVNRNRDRLWRYDNKYYNKTPRTIAMEIIDDPNFVSRMNTDLNKERTYKISNSESCAEALRGGDDNGLTFRRDPFMQSLRTSRDARKAHMEATLAPALLQHGPTHQRGYKHAIDFGNFSTYNAVLKTNQATTMNR
mmetsp:Transcript_18078/g.30361  ORF Transcript_18078/g.30361 Transcript_18078/m.30361 type:complete len:257 (-) Transcript_18078:51-821(-)